MQLRRAAAKVNPEEAEAVGQKPGRGGRGRGRGRGRGKAAMKRPAAAPRPPCGKDVGDDDEVAASQEPAPVDEMGQEELEPQEPQEQACTGAKKRKPKVEQTQDTQQKKKRSRRNEEEQAVMDALPELERYYVSHLMIY